MDKGYRVVYIWENGAFVSDADHEFADHYKELVDSFGPPTLTEVRGPDDFDTEPKT
jgi:hypothetical protein